MIEGKTQTLQASFHKVSEQMYAAAAAQQAQAAGGAGNGAADGAGAGEEEVVDAEVVDAEEQR